MPATTTRDGVIRPEPGSPEERELVEGGDIELLGRMPWSSNATFLVKLDHAGTESLAIYKPRKGDRPLWDFPRGTLSPRGVAAPVVSGGLGWGTVRLPTLPDGRAGSGRLRASSNHAPGTH